MAAGLGFKTFTTGEVLTAADVNGYLMQGVGVFADAANRDAEITSPQEGQFAYLKDTNVTTYYTGSAWANLDTTGMTNPMTTTGDTIYSSSGSTPARLGIGTTGQVLTVSGGLPSWATPASGGGMTLLSTTTLSGTSTVISSISQSYKQLYIVGSGITFSASANFFVSPNSSSGNIEASGTSGANAVTASDIYVFTDNSLASNSSNGFVVQIDNYTSTNRKPIEWYGNHASGSRATIAGGCAIHSAAITSLQFRTVGGTATLGGTILLYGVN
jgi:hypothetical protein